MSVDISLFSLANSVGWDAKDKVDIRCVCVCVFVCVRVRVCTFMCMHMYV